MDRRALVHELISLVEQTRSAEIAYFAAHHKVAVLKFELLGAECDLYNSDQVKGKNETIRAAEMWPSTNEVRHAIIDAEYEEDQLRCEYNHLRRKLEVLKLVAQIGEIDR
jgi:hypothetical protein